MEWRIPVALELESHHHAHLDLLLELEHLRFK